jgi:hypothetical protein
VCCTVRTRWPVCRVRPDFSMHGHRGCSRRSSRIQDRLVHESVGVSF